MPDSKKRTGSWGEQIALRYILKKGYAVVDTNWYCRYGEIDIVAYDPDPDQYIFIEVKTRRSAFPPDIELLIPPKKREAQHAAIECYVQEKSIRSDYRWDIVVVWRRPRGRTVVQHFSRMDC